MNATKRSRTGETMRPWQLTRFASSMCSPRTRARLPAILLCVFEDGGGLSTEEMQALARQFNLSETTFILPSTARAIRACEFSHPSYEMAFAGHPTLGTAHVCRALEVGRRFAGAGNAGGADTGARQRRSLDLDAPWARPRGNWTYRATPSLRRWDSRQPTSASGRSGSKRARNSWWCR